MIETVDIKLENGNVQGIKIPLQQAPIILIKSTQGYVMCGYLNMESANKLGDTAAKITGINTIEDALDAPIVELSEDAESYNVKIGTSARTFLNTILRGK